MSSPGFTGGRAPEFYGGVSRSVAATVRNDPTNANNLQPSSLHPLYRTQQQQQHPAIFLDPYTQIARQNPSLIRKRTLAEFQTHQQNHNNQVLSSLLLRSVKPRTFQNSSPMSPMSPMDFSMSPELPNSSVFSSQRFGVPLLQQSRPQTMNLPNAALSRAGFQYLDGNLAQESEKKVMDHRLQELEKQLLEDNDEEEGDPVSVITSSEWSLQNLISPGAQKPISSSPTSSTTSTTSSSSSVLSPTSTCLKQSLMEAASAIADGKSDSAAEILSRLAQFSNPNGNSDNRLTDCMISALKSRVNPQENPPAAVELFSSEHAESTQLLYEHSPCFKVGFMAANLAILEAAFDDNTENNGSNKLHVVDFDIGRGKQYINLLHALSARQNGKLVMVYITAVAENGSEERLKVVGDMLKQQAEQLGVGFEFRAITQQLTELTRESLGCEPHDPLAVNFAFKLYRMPDESVSTENPRDELLRRVKGLAPRVVTLVEQEINTNTAPFTSRVSESCSYYGALFDSLESTISRDNSERVKVEQGLSRKLNNSIACEGRDRVERCEVFGKWKARMSMAGFQLKGMNQRIAEQLKVRLSQGNRVNPGFTVKEENGGICFGWMGRTLTVASAWR
ncbi:scarecrow-like protein 8 [Prosopis cineraria]|uniref:scarecrow-like protein 8 n=1 Tax=Prosopis cineraria TaxID=364024 RepID=UPI00240F1958|nr:scarecrow-like protein 8 [Prosopis cineraria]